MRVRTVSLLAGVAGALALAGPAHAGKTAMSLALDGTSSPVLAYSWGVSNTGSMHNGGGGSTGRSSFQDISLTRAMDATSPGLVRSASTGRHHDEATLSIVNGPFTASYCLRDVLVTSISQGGSAGEALTENVSLNFGEFTFKVGSSSFGFNIAESDLGGPPC